ncbi:hypothetical protein BJF90_10360 [Pseudonocardia sp. CNS-004]|nr:hypothetical protein BJF90_10360 [Pseudonocardia sp. CNS-004]
MIRRSRIGRLGDLAMSLFRSLSPAPAGSTLPLPGRNAAEGVRQVPDVWSMVSKLDAATQERLADVLETRGADAQQQRMRDAFLADIGFPAARGCWRWGVGRGC